MKKLYTKKFFLDFVEQEKEKYNDADGYYFDCEYLLKILSKYREDIYKILNCDAERVRIRTNLEREFSYFRLTRGNLSYEEPKKKVILEDNYPFFRDPLEIYNPPKKIKDEDLEEWKRLTIMNSPFKRQIALLRTDINEIRRFAEDNPDLFLDESSSEDEIDLDDYIASRIDNPGRNVNIRTPSRENWKDSIRYICKFILTFVKNVDFKDKITRDEFTNKIRELAPDRHIMTEALGIAWKEASNIIGRGPGNHSGKPRISKKEREGKA